MTRKHSFAELINRLYFSAIGAASWDELLAALAERLEANYAGLMVHDPENREYSVAHQVGAPQQAQREYAEHFGRYDIHFQAAVAARGTLQAGLVQLSQDVISVPKLRRTYYYNDFLRRYDILHQCGVIIASQGSRLSTITLTRPHGMDEFQLNEQRFLARLTPHLQASFALHRYMIDLRVTQQSLQAAFDASPKPSLVVDSEMKILAINAKAKAFVDRSATLAVLSGCLVATAPCESDRLKSLVKLSSKKMIARRFPISRADKTTITLSLTPLVQDAIGICNGSSVLIVVEDPLLDKDTVYNRLRSHFGLTASEARVAMLLAGGATLKEIGDLLSVTRNTLKTHLRRIFLKTDTKRQAELVGVLQRNL